MAGGGAADRTAERSGRGGEDAVVVGLGECRGCRRRRGAEALTKRVAAILPGTDLTVHEPPSVESLELPEPRVAVPDSLAGLASTDHADRAAHAHGQAFRDVVRNLMGDVQNPPDVVVRPRNEADIVDVLDWASRANVAVIPFGGGTSVVGGVEPRIGDHGRSVGTNGDHDFAGAISLDLAALDQVLEIDRTSRAARIQAGSSVRRWRISYAARI